MRDMYKNAGILPEVYDFCSKIEKSLDARMPLSVPTLLAEPTR